MFSTAKTRMMMLQYAEERKYDDMLSHLDTILKCDRQMNRQADRIAVSLSLAIKTEIKVHVHHPARSLSLT